MASSPQPPHPAGAGPETDAETALMARHGITRTVAHHYHVDGYRYTRLADALAQAARS